MSWNVGETCKFISYINYYLHYSRYKQFPDLIYEPVLWLSYNIKCNYKGINICKKNDKLIVINSQQNTWPYL